MAGLDCGSVQAAETENIYRTKNLPAHTGLPSRWASYLPAVQLALLRTSHYLTPGRINSIIMV